MKLTTTEESRYRRLAGASRCPVVVIAGDGKPTATGERAYHTWKGSNTSPRHPGAAIKAGYKLDYHRSTYQVEVGIEFVRAERRAKLETSLRSARRALARVLAPDAPLCVQADWLEENGREREASLMRELAAI